MKIVENRNKFFVFSGAIILVGIIFMIVNAIIGNGALNYDVEFSGGTSMHVNVGQDFSNDDIAQIVSDVTGQRAQIQRVVGTDEVMVKTQTLDIETRTKIVDLLKEKYGISDADVLNVSDVSPTVSNEMLRTALLAILLACLAMLIYVSFRFRDYKTGASAIIALVHDVLIVLSVYSVIRIPVNNAFIAAILTILGYSINATIVIFDRIRENKKRVKRSDIETLINSSVKQTFNRSIFTSLTTFFTIACLYIFGVQSIKEFMLPLIIGVIFGTYSSICISGSFWYMLARGDYQKYAPDKQKAKAKSK